MNLIECRPVEPSEAALWNAYVDSHPQAQLGHRFEWRNVFEGAYRKRCPYLVATRDGSWVGVLPLVRMRGFLSSRQLVSLPFLDHAGVLADSDEVAGVLTQTAIDLSRSMGARGVELRRLAPEGVGGDSRAAMILDLPDSDEELWKSFKPKVRNQVRNAEKKHGLVTRIGTKEDRTEFYRVFCRNMRDLGSPVHARSFLEGVLDEFGDAARLWVTASSEGRIVGGAIAIQAQDMITVPWASSLREFFSQCPNHSLYWEILKDAASSEAKRFDFGRSWIGAGTYRFKKQWGAKPHALSWASFDTSGRPEAAQAYRPTDHETIVKIWSRLPLPVANVLGPIIRQQLSQ